MQDQALSPTRWLVTMKLSADFSSSEGTRRSHRAAKGQHGLGPPQQWRGGSRRLLLRVLWRLPTRLRDPLLLLGNRPHHSMWRRRSRKRRACVSHLQSPKTRTCAKRGYAPRSHYRRDQHNSRWAAEEGGRARQDQGSRCRVARHECRAIRW